MRLPFREIAARRMLRFDQSIVACDNRLSYACILIFPKSTKVYFGVPVFPLAMT